MIKFVLGLIVQDIVKLFKDSDKLVVPKIIATSLAPFHGGREFPTPSLYESGFQRADGTGKCVCMCEYTTTRVSRRYIGERNIPSVLTAAKGEGRQGRAGGAARQLYLTAG